MGAKQSKPFELADTDTQQRDHPKQNIFCTSATRRDDSVQTYSTNNIASSCSITHTNGNTHNTTTVNGATNTKTLRVKNSEHDSYSLPLKKTKVEERGTQTNKTKKAKMLKEIKERESTIIAMSSTAEKLCHVCRTSAMASVLDSSDCSLCPDGFTRNLRFVEKNVIKQNFELSRKQSDLDSALNRLSAIAGDKLINNNPNIANLQDSKRPTKIAEQYKDLYDNEWTDTMELFEKKFEKSDASVTKFVYHLSSVVKVVYRTCRRKSTLQMKMIAEHFFLLKSPSDEQIEGTWINHPSERTRIIECRKNAADGIILNLQATLADDEIFLSEIVNCDPQLDQTLLEEIVASDYFRKCVELCWRFVIQDPPLYLETDSLKGHTLNKEEYTEFTKPGKVISYVVWPALYLYQDDNKTTNGPLLAKGVAQPK